MPILLNCLTAAMLLMIAALHFISVLLPKYPKATLAVNLSLHTLLLFPLLYFGCGVDTVVMLYTASVTLRAILYTVSYKRRGGE